MSTNSPITIANRRRAGPPAGERTELRAPRLALCLLLPLLVAGCFQHEVVVRVNRDGSGTIVERVVMSHEAVEMLAQMEPEGKPFQLRSVEQLRADAAKYGEAVRLHSGRNIETDFGRGYEAKYVFEDVGRLRINQNPEDSVPGNRGAGTAGDAGPARYTTFSLRRGDPAELVIRWGGEGSSASASGDESEDLGAADADEIELSPEDQEAMVELMQSVFKDLRMAIHVEVAGEIVDTNATHRQDNRVTLADIAFGELLSSEEALLEMARQKPQSVADMKQLMTLLPGLKLEIEPEVAIRFR